MAWIVAGILGALLVLFHSLYWRALSEARQLVNLLVLVLMDEKLRDVQRKGLLEFITNSTAKTPAELGTAVNLATTNLAVKLKGNTLGVAGLLWKAKKEGNFERGAGLG